MPSTAMVHVRSRMKKLSEEASATLAKMGNFQFPMPCA